MIVIHGVDIRTGDVITDHAGRVHEIAHVDRRDGWAWPVALEGAGWAIALGDELVAVHRAA